jgi:hypothetical protein
VTAALTAVGALATGVVGYRVLGPAETVTPASAPYPPAVPATAGVTGQLGRAPLVVAGRLRVYAAKRQVWADRPIGSRTETTPFWSLRRWPQQVLGVVAAPVGPAEAQLVVSRWSDGELLATDAQSGRIAWRVRGPVDRGAGYAGGRTGASTVYGPAGLYASDSVVVATGGGQAEGLDAASGAPLWTVPVCRGTSFTGDGFFAMLDRCQAPPALRRYDLRTGRELAPWRPPGETGMWGIEPVSCAVGNSACPAMRTPGAGWLFSGTDIVPAPPLATPGSWLTGGLAIGPDGTARDARTGDPQWIWEPGSPDDTSPARIVAVETGAVYLLTRRHTMVVLDPSSGLELSRFPVDRVGAPTDWEPGYVHASDRFVVVERLSPDLPVRPVLVAGA